jgi:CheY-like chemotaxis protein
MESEVSEEQPGLQERADAWAVAFREMLAAEWIDAIAEGMHARLDALVIESDIEGVAVLSSSALELSTYLCSFLGGHVDPPNPAQRRQMCRLADVLSPGTRGAGEALLAAAPDDEPPAPAARPASTAFGSLAALDADVSALPGNQVWSVIEDIELVSILTEAFAERGIAYFPCAPHTAVAQSIPETGVQCVIVDNGSLAVLLELQHRALISGSAAGPRATYVALLQDHRTDERLRALRAGADHVITYSDDAATMAGRIDKILAARSEEPLRVLVVDDDRSQTRFCAGILSRVGIQATCCHDAASALDVLRQGFPDILLVDLHMPEIDGLALTEMLLEMPGSEQVAILFLSGDEEPETRFDALSAGGDDFLSKPIQPRHLIRAVAAHGKRVHRRRRAAAAH